MSVTARYDAILVAICATPPFKKLAATIRSEDCTEPVNQVGATQRDLAVKYCKAEFGKILNAIRDTEKILRGTP